MSSFIGYLQLELGNSKYCTALRQYGNEVAFITLDLLVRREMLLIYNESGLSSSIWSFTLSDGNVLQHMEEDVGISDPAGLSSFAAYFCDALLSPISFHIDVDHYPTNLASNLLALNFEYKIGLRIFDGQLKMNLVARELRAEVFEMMATVFSIDQSKQITRETRLSRPQIATSSFQFRKQGKEVSADANLDAATATADEEDAGPVKAKKRKAVGVNLFNNKRYTLRVTSVIC